MFITLEGGEGAGKSTQARLLAEALTEEGQAVLVTREPGGPAGAEALRALLLGGQVRFSATSETYLHFAARAEHLERSILPALAAGMTVVCDRFADSTMAYQGYGLGGDRRLISALTRLLPRQPDLTLILRVAPGLGAARLRNRPGAPDRYERLDAAFHQRVAQGFAEIGAADPGRCRMIDADGEVEAVRRAVLDAVREEMT